ncbi:MAG: NAD(P)/FAD-dependent oxidoreductase [Candidatus Omnitrophica bacterium]|nr:NAD(P)/FAD-dependent oxidoreductase [Candidatus Omnitrophota bacterium]
MRTAVPGAGPAGLAAAYELSRAGLPCDVIEKSSSPGGLCRTLNRDGFLFDIGGHRFLSRSEEVNALWRLILGDDLLTRRRKSRIHFRGRFFDYPLRPLNALSRLGPMESALCAASYARARLFPPKDISSFESWMIRRFGRRLYENFFKTYTEKVWGIPCSELSSDWAEQRIQKLTLRQAVLRSLLPASGPGIKTLSDSFLYPRLGPGQFMEGLRLKAEDQGCVFSFGRDVREICVSGQSVLSVSTVDRDGVFQTWEAENFLCSLPLPLIVRKLRPMPPDEILDAAASLKFRSFIAVNLVFDSPDLFDDQWIYLHSPSVRAGRLQNYKNWSPGMVPDPSKTSLGAEYFVTEGDDVWRMDDSALIGLALGELSRLGIADTSRFISGFTVRVAHAYPVYNPGYDRAVARIRDYLSRYRNFQVMGRAGLFRYNNSDHALLTGLRAARNIGGASYDLWNVDPDAETAAGESL